MMMTTMRRRRSSVSLARIPMARRFPPTLSSRTA
uniref:Uncharacterized protein n=1 Tax=Rhizophora mucronata TaxID=61149 RepID=A0A2P2IL81_RHIMU